MIVSAQRLRQTVGSRMGNNPRRVTRANQNTNKYLCDPLPTWKGGYLKCNRIFKRAEYFRVFRPERTALKVCMNTYISSVDRKEYRALRYIYYSILPHLARYLWFGPDRDQIYQLEHYIYNQMLSYLFAKGADREPNRVTVWKNRIPTHEVGPNSESSKEPTRL